MKRMRVYAKAIRAWLPRAPRWTALLLGVLIAADAAYIVLRLRAAARTLEPRPAAVARPAGLDAQRIAAAHLFGVDPAAERSGGASASETALHWVLSGVIASADPNEGYAILGEQGQATRLYRTGAALANADSAMLYEVFTDHVVLDFGGRRETLSLPRQHLDTSGARRVARFDAPARTEDIPLPISLRHEAPSAAQGWFSNLYAERHTTDGRMGLRLHPAMRFQRRYGLRDGDTLTAVDGVPAGDEDAVNGVLRSGANTIALTLMRDGVEETVRLPIEE